MTSELFNSCPSVFVHKVRNVFRKANKNLQAQSEI